MTEKQWATDERGQTVKRPGWFSWRHETRGPHGARKRRPD